MANEVLKLRSTQKYENLSKKKNFSKKEEKKKQINEETTMTKVHKCQAKNQYSVSKHISHVDREKKKKTYYRQNGEDANCGNAVNMKNTLDRTINSLRISETSAPNVLVGKESECCAQSLECFLRVRFQCYLARR